MFQRLEKALAALRGIAACGTKCECCEMLRRVAQKALDDCSTPPPIKSQADNDMADRFRH